MPALPSFSPSAFNGKGFRQRGRFTLGALLAVLVLAVGAAGAWWLVSQPPRIERRAPVEAPAPLVDTVQVQRQSAAPELHAFGRVIAEREARIASRVAGELQDFTAEALPGRVVEAGTALVRIDDSDLRLALREAEAALAQAEAQLAMERGEQQRAEAEYRSFGRELTAERRALVLRQPQLRHAEAEVERARAARDRARLELERSTLVAPWPGMVQAQLLGAGSMLASGTEVIHLVDVSRFWVRVSLPGEALGWLKPAGTDGPGSSVRLSTRTWASGEARRGEVIAILPALEEQGLQAQLLVAIEDPLGLENGAPALRLGDVVRLEFEPRPREGLFTLPAAALRPGNVLWVLDDEERLRRRTVSVIHHGETRVLVDEGLEEGERVVTSQLGQPRDGMRLRQRIADQERPAGESQEPRS
ncbi:efflux RND transporter periplasmic adaptor subunit [Billgrantia kenyensis]|uniref:Efflux RND transporter periplasmic adaptor subunit n=1 Tax=Billgrantia kenyensis TaxID=321266 RepID=A0A7V9VZP5_9GAMM|nr:efflux RND transporter periplasmic adaptor subunit [Halomonas kenyensis]MBA2778340.1 efflux RND transporter periplasmic adaptor subunit [Halomonas kenyensis]MCG6660646.1 efflux RND transporter periplasmic adaptor subunit [Halomonas kenyensis]